MVKYESFSSYTKGTLLKQFFFLLIFFIKAYVVGTHLNCFDKSIQFKWAPPAYTFIKK